MPKPILFLDFDCTLFDTAQFYEWLGPDIEGRIAQLVAGAVAEPDFFSMLYPDTLDFLKQAEQTHHRVLLSYANNIPLQKKKVAGSGIAAQLDAVIIVPGTMGDGGKAREAERYLQSQAPSAPAVFVDDAPENISEMKIAHPHIRCIRIDRAPREDQSLISALVPPDTVVATLPQLLCVL